MNCVFQRFRTPESIDLTGDDDKRLNIYSSMYQTCLRVIHKDLSIDSAINDLQDAVVSIKWPQISRESN